MAINHERNSNWECNEGPPLCSDENRGLLFFSGQFFFKSPNRATDCESYRPPKEVFYGLFESVEKTHCT